MKRAASDLETPNPKPKRSLSVTPLNAPASPKQPEQPEQPEHLDKADDNATAGEKRPWEIAFEEALRNAAGLHSVSLHVLTILTAKSRHFCLHALFGMFSNYI